MGLGQKKVQNYADVINEWSLSKYVQLQNQEMISEGDLACAMDQSNKIREMQDKISNLRAQVPIFIEFIYNLCISPARPE